MKQAISRSIVTAIAIYNALAISSPTQAASLTVSGIKFAEATSDVNLLNGIQDSKTRKFVLFQDVTATDVALKIEGFPRVKPISYMGSPVGAISIQLVVTNKSNTYWTAAKHELKRQLSPFDPSENKLAFAMPKIGACSADILMSVCNWQWKIDFTSDEFKTIDGRFDTATFFDPISKSIAPGETVTFNYAIADWGEGGFYLKQSYTGYSEQVKSVPEPTSIFSLLAFGTVGFASLQKRKKQMT